MFPHENNNLHSSVWPMVFSCQLLCSFDGLRYNHIQFFLAKEKEKYTVAIQLSIYEDTDR